MATQSIPGNAEQGMGYCTGDPYRLIKGLKPEKEELLKRELQGICDTLSEAGLSHDERKILIGNRMMTLDRELGPQTWRPTFEKNVAGESLKKLILLPLDSMHCSNILQRADTYYELPIADLRQKNLLVHYHSEVSGLPTHLQVPYGHWIPKVPKPGDVAVCVGNPDQSLIPGR